jgi:hypothetical protein
MFAAHTYTFFVVGFDFECCQTQEIDKGIVGRKCSNYQFLLVIDDYMDCVFLIRYIFSLINAKFTTIFVCHTMGDNYQNVVKIDCF